MGHSPTMGEFLGTDAPTNWGKWGPEDEVGCLNYLDNAAVLHGVLHGVQEIRSGEVFTLQAQMGHPRGDPHFPGRESIHRQNAVDESSWASGGRDAPDLPGGVHYADDKATIFLQGSTQYDALGHAWYDGKLWNGYDAQTTVGGLKKASVLPITERGTAGRGVLINMAWHRNKEYLDKGETFDRTDLQDAANAQGTEISQRDILLIRTGFLSYFYSVSADEFYDGFVEPGLTYSRELVQWFQDMEIPNLVTDTIANEVTKDPRLRSHAAAALRVDAQSWCNDDRDFSLDDLAAACAEDGRWSFLYTALKVVEATGAPVNPVVIR